MVIYRATRSMVDCLENNRIMEVCEKRTQGLVRRTLRAQHCGFIRNDLCPDSE